MSSSPHGLSRSLPALAASVLCCGWLIADLGAQDLPAPTDILCLAFSPTYNVVFWQSSATDATRYLLERRVEGSSTGYELLSPIPTNMDFQYRQPHYGDATAEATKAYFYRVRVQRGTDDACSDCSAYSAEVRSPRFFDSPGGNFRIFYNSSAAEAPPLSPRNDSHRNYLEPEEQSTVLDFLGRVLEGVRTEYAQQGFPPLWNADPAQPIPVNLKAVSAPGQLMTDFNGLTLWPEYLGTYDPSANSGSSFTFTAAMHELFHGVWNAYYQMSSSRALLEPWLVEGPPDAMVDKSCVLMDAGCPNADDDTSTGYHGWVYNYLGDPSRTLIEQYYPAALFWTYVCDRYGRERVAEPRIGTDFIRSFDQMAVANPQLDAIAVMDRTLEAYGQTARFVNVFTDFAVANYAKAFTSLVSFPGSFKYTDDVQPTPYPAVRVDLALDLAAGQSVSPKTVEVDRWSARYVELRPAASVPLIDLHFRVSTEAPVHFAMIQIRAGQITGVHEESGRELRLSFANQGFDKIAVIVVGLDQPAEVRFTVNGPAQAQLSIVEPGQGHAVCLGPPTAPGRFLAKVEAFDPTSLSRIEGLPLGSFSFKVDGLPCGVITSLVVGAQYWFVLQAPMPRDNVIREKPLSVEVPGLLTGTDPAAVYHCEAACCSAADTVIVFDRSGSMRAAEKLVPAKEAGKLYADSFESGDQIGLVSFNSTASDPAFNLTLQAWTESSRQAAAQKIEAIAAQGGTSIGTGLGAALNELVSRGSPEGNWAIVLLSDGKNTVDPGIEAYLEQHQQRLGNPDANQRKVPKVFTVGIGVDADRPDLQRLADATGGSYHFIAEPPAAAGAGGMEGQGAGGAGDDFSRDIAEVFRSASEAAVGEDQVLAVRGTAVRGQPAQVIQIPVDATATALEVAVFAPLAAVTLRDAAKNPIPPAVTTLAHRVFRVEPVRSALYEVIVAAPSCPEGGCALSINYLVEASMQSEITMALHLPLPVEERMTGAAMPILVTLHGRGPIRFAAVEAVVDLPGGGTETIALLDDGAHSDGGAADGVYGGTLHHTSEPGDYRVTATASAGFKELGTVLRRRRASFHLRSGGDKDLDGLPDAYEVRAGLQPLVADDQDDPDLDGSSNRSEFLRGTDPFDPDTDDDGEGDRTDPNPHAPGDASIAPPRIRALAGPGRVDVEFTIPDGAEGFEVLRATGSAGDFNVYIEDLPLPQRNTDPVLADRRVTDGTVYRYRFVAFGPGKSISAPSNIAEAVPRADPYAPFGEVLINGGATVAQSVKAKLTLNASDDPRLDHLASLVGFDPKAIASGVVALAVSNRADFLTGKELKPVSFEPFSTRKEWILEPDASGLAVVFVRFQDAGGNVSETAVDTILVRDGTGGGFRRADANGDGKDDISDAVFTLGFLFLGTAPTLACADAADSNDDGKVNISDPIHTLAFLFSGGPPPPSPQAACGVDPTPDGLDCAVYPLCQ